MFNDLPPHDANAESRVISAWFYDEAFQRAWSPEDGLFYIRGHEEIVKAMHDLRQSGAVVTPPHLILELRRRKQLDHIGGPDEVHRIIHESPSVATPWEYLDRLRELRAMRELRLRMVEASKHLTADGTFAAAHAALSKAQTESAGMLASRVVTHREMISSVANDALRDGGGKPSNHVASTQNMPLDVATGGFRRKHVWAFGAATSWGKTSQLVAWADECLLQGKRALIVSGEDSQDMYATRLLARRAQVRAIAMRDGCLNQGERDRVVGAVSESADIPLFLDAIGKHAEAVASEVRSICAADGIDVVFVDYIQAFSAAKRCEDRRNEIAHMARTFTAAIKGSDAAGVIFSQITMKPGQTRPNRDNIRDCRDVSNGAEGVMLGYTDKNGRKMLFVDKVKDGPPQFDVTMRWDTDIACFMNITEDDVPDVPDAVWEDSGPAFWDD